MKESSISISLGYNRWSLACLCLGCFFFPNTNAVSIILLWPWMMIPFWPLSYINNYIKASIWQKLQSVKLYIYTTLKQQLSHQAHNRKASYNILYQSCCFATHQHSTRFANGAEDGGPLPVNSSGVTNTTVRCQQLWLNKKGWWQSQHWESDYNAWWHRFLLMLSSLGLCEPWWSDTVIQEFGQSCFLVQKILTL